MHLVQLLLPLYANDGRAQPPEAFRRVRAELTERFGGLTAHTRAPAEGLWKEEDDEPPVRDDVVLVEVMVDDLDAAWWAGYRRELEKRFRQDAIVVRALGVRLL